MIFLIYSVPSDEQLRILGKLQSLAMDVFEIPPRVSNSLGRHVLAIFPR